MSKPLVLCLICTLLIIPAARAAEDSLLFNAPNVEGIVVDGDSADWGKRGLEIGIMTMPDGRVMPPDDFDPAFRLAWDNRGLLLLLTVRDDVPFENPDIGTLWMRDSIEAFVAPKLGGPDYYQVAVAPGRTSDQPELRYFFYDFRKTEPKRELAVEAARTTTDQGYVLEVLFPWQNLSATPTPGDEIGFQLFVNDSDGPGDRFQVQFYPLFYAHNSSRMHRVRLAANAGPKTLAKAWPEYYAMGRIRLDILTTGDLAAETIEARLGHKKLAETAPAEAKGRAQGKLLLPAFPKGKQPETVAIFARNEPIGTAQLAKADEARTLALMSAPIGFRPCVFTGEAFPECDFDDPRRIEGLLGAYTVKKTFYDNEYNEVTVPGTPGRYGAVIEVIPDQGRPIKRFRTLLRLPDDAKRMSRWTQPEMTIAFPLEYGFDPNALAENETQIKGYVWASLIGSFERNPSGGSLMAALYEAKPAGLPVRDNENLAAQDRQWWVGLKRKVYATESAWPRPFVCPRPIEGDPAPILGKGTETAAGMKSGATQKLDALLKEWAANSDEAFSVCLARNGVVFLHDAYGPRDGKPISVTTKSYMASLTKLLSGTLMMMCVDQGRVKLDDGVDIYLPPFRGIEVETPLTVRHLYTHTSGMRSSGGDEMNDFEEVSAEYYPFLLVGKEHLYGGAGYALGGKIIEAVSGEALPEFFLNHLLDPLDCPNTDVLDTAGGARSTAIDIAKIGQMLLNRGAYGTMRFFTEKTFEEMMPKKLSEVIGLDTDLEWGIGVVWMPAKGLSKKTFAHGAASSATLLIDPDNKLVISMTRNSAGANFSKYHEQFIATIVENLVDPAQVETY